MIKYTTQKWLTPKGNFINEVGVTPTKEVKLSEDYLKIRLQIMTINYRKLLI